MSRRALAVALGAVIAAGAAGASAAPPVTTPMPDELRGLSLACDGTGAWVETVVDDNGTIGKFKDDTETKHARSAQGRVRVRFGDVASYRLPPTFAGRPRDWINLSGVVTEGDLIVGRSKGLFGWSDTLRIDRKTGEIELRDLGLTFSGTCEKAPEPTETRKF